MYPHREWSVRGVRYLWMGIALIISLAALLLLVPSIGGSLTHPGASNLSRVEVREYEGQMLSSIEAFEENSLHGPIRIHESTYRLNITGRVDNPATYTYAQVLSSFPHYRKIVTLQCVEGWEATILWDGIRVIDLLDASGVDPEASVVIFRAADGYSSSLPLTYLREHNILLAYAMNNCTLPVERGFPFQLVAEEKWGYKWVRWITDIEVSTDTGYRGTWEARGYSLNGSIQQSFFAWWPW